MQVAGAPNKGPTEGEVHIEAAGKVCLESVVGSMHMANSQNSHAHRSGPDMVHSLFSLASACARSEKMMPGTVWSARSLRSPVFGLSRKNIVIPTVVIGAVVTVLQRCVRGQYVRVGKK